MITSIYAWYKYFSTWEEHTTNILLTVYCSITINTISEFCIIIIIVSFVIHQNTVKTFFMRCIVVGCSEAYITCSYIKKFLPYILVGGTCLSWNVYTRVLWPCWVEVTDCDSSIDKEKGITLYHLQGYQKLTSSSVLSDIQTHSAWYLQHN